MRNTDHIRKGRRALLAAPPRTPAGLALLLAAMLALAATLMIVHSAQAFAQNAPDLSQEAQESQERGRPGNAGNSDDGGSGNSLGVIVDIPEGWPLDDKGGDPDIVRFEKCFPFCNVERPDGGSSQDSTLIGGGEQTSVIEQTQITQETQTDEGGADEGNSGGTGDGDEGNAGGGGDEDEPEEPTISEETTLLEETTSEGTTAPPGETVKCPTGPSGPISEVALTRVLDADTLQVEGSDGNAYTIRLIGAEAPDLAGAGAEGGEDEPGAEEAAAFARETLGGRVQTFELEYDEQKTDENGQTFAYVWMPSGPDGRKPGTTQELPDRLETAGPVLFNRHLVESGYARAATAEPNTDYAGCLKQAENLARGDGNGLWFTQTSSPETGSAPGAGAAAGAPRATEIGARDGAVEAISIELVSRKSLPSESRAGAGAKAEANAEENAKDVEIPPITGHARAPEPPQAREAHPGITIGLVFIAFLAGAAVLARAVARADEPAGIGSPEGRN